MTHKRKTPQGRSQGGNPERVPGGGCLTERQRSIALAIFYLAAADQETIDAAVLVLKQGEREWRARVTGFQRTGEIVQSHAARLRPRNTKPAPL